MHTTVSSFHTQKNLAIVQLATSDQDSFNYVGCGKAFGEKLIQVKELNDAGSVNMIYVMNNSDSFVFIMDGDILAGAKQNRVANTSMLLAPQSKSRIPVSCVEHGRWHSVSTGFSTTTYTAPASLRASKSDHVRGSLRQNRGFSSNQGEIWGRVEEYQSAHKVVSETSNLSDIFDRKEGEFEKFLGGFVPDPAANGMAVFIGNTLAGADIFGRKDVYLEYFPKLLRAAAFDAASTKSARKKLTEPEAKYRTLELLDTVEELQREERPAVGVGLDRRFESPAVTGFELVYDRHLVHLAAFTAKG
jgi:hypothetical protein